MMENNPKLRSKTYSSIRNLKFVRDSFKELYKQTEDDNYSLIHQELNKCLMKCLDSFCEDIEDLADCNCLCEAGFDAEWMNLSDSMF